MWWKYNFPPCLASASEEMSAPPTGIRATLLCFYGKGNTSEDRPKSATGAPADHEGTAAGTRRPFRGDYLIITGQMVRLRAPPGHHWPGEAIVFFPPNTRLWQHALNKHNSVVGLTVRTNGGRWRLGIEGGERPTRALERQVVSSKISSFKPIRCGLGGLPSSILLALQRVPHPYG